MPIYASTKLFSQNMRPRWGRDAFTVCPINLLSLRDKYKFNTLAYIMPT